MDTTQKIVKIQQCFISIAEMGKIKIAKLSGAKNGARSDFFPHYEKLYALNTERILFIKLSKFNHFS